MGKLTPFGLLVRTELMRRGISVSAMARELGYSGKSICGALKGERSGKKYRQSIERYLDIDEADVWEHALSGKQG